MTTSTQPIPEKDRPDYESAAVKAMLPDLMLVRDVAAGQRRITERTTTYLPQHPKEEPANYRIRLGRPTFFNAFMRTLEGLVGMVFRTSPELGDDVPKVVEEHWENIDKEGNHGEVFLKTVFADALEAGHCAIFVDYPAIPNPATVTRADERALDLRPYWVHVRKDEVMNFRTSRSQGGERVLDQITLRFRTHEQDEAFGDKLVVRYRVYQRIDGTVRWEIWQEGEDKIPRPTGERGVILKQDRIPIVFIYGRQTGFGESRPPLLDLANLNILHYQTNADYFHAMHIACVPVPVAIGMQEGALVVGPNASLSLPQGGDFKYVETSGAALAAARQALEDLEGQMAVMGLSLLQGEKRAAETAEAKRLDKSEKDSALSTAARALQDGVEQALMFHANYLGEQQAGSITINQDFMAEAMTPDQVRVLSEAVAKGQLSLETMWTKLQEGEWLPDDFDADLEKQRLTDSGALLDPNAPPPPPAPARMMEVQNPDGSTRMRLVENR